MFYSRSLITLLRWVVLVVVVALLTGSACALFLWSLDIAIQTRNQHPWLVACLPAAGFGMAWIYLKVGQSVERGNNLLFDTVNQPTLTTIPFRMAPLILLTTVLSHLFGASVGREGTAVQMGGALADQLSPWFKLNSDERRILLLAGIAGGFAAVFGTPWAGAVFVFEVLAIGQWRTVPSNADGLLKTTGTCCIALVTALLADYVGLAWGIEHTYYSAGNMPDFGIVLLLHIVVASLAFGLMARLFSTLSHHVTGWFKSTFAYAPIRPAIGGAMMVCVVAGASMAQIPVQHYLGLGIPIIEQAFTEPLASYDFLGKMLMTVASLGSGFKGGEVTPLFYMGATLGNALSNVLLVPLPMLAGLGFVAVFAGAANTPLACTVMAIELFGPPVSGWAFRACYVSYGVSGNRGIYSAQRVLKRKFLP